jgi:hypothetical protein
MSTNTTQNTDSEPPETYDALCHCSRGDRIRINGTEYLVADTTSGMRNLVSPSNPILLVDGECRELIMGQLPHPHTDVDGVMWRETLRDTDSIEPSDLLASYDDVAVIDGPESDTLDQLPQTTDTVCPYCGHDSCEWQAGEYDGDTVQSLYTCLNTDSHCNGRFVRARDVDTDDSATAVVLDSDGDEHEIELHGVYRETITSRFQLDPRRNEQEAWYTATEVATFLEQKAGAAKDDDKRHGHVEPNGLTFGRGHKDNPTWRDDAYDTKMMVTFHPV